MAYRLFVSGVSDDYRETRVWLAAELRKAGCHAVVQDELVELGQNTLVKLAESVAKESDVVIHLIGPKLGSVPPAGVLGVFLAHLGGEDAVRAKLPALFENDAHRRVTYTQWEAWLALFHVKHLLICEDTAPAAEAAAGALTVAEHLRLLKPERGYAIGFADRAGLRDGVQKALLRLQNQNSFHEDRPRNLPLATLGELFIGRDPFLADLAARFRAARAAHPTAYPNHLIHGVGGVGKTRAAVEYGLRSEHLYAALLFVNGETASDLERTLADLSGVLKLNLPAAATNPERLDAVKTWLKAHPGWLLVVDNVDDQAARDAVNGWLKEWHGGHVVITGRYVHWGKDVVPLELGVLAPADARDFLLRATDGRRKAKPDDAAVARSIAVDDLGQLCLALEQASAYVRTREIALAEYQARWRANAKGVRTWADKVLMKYHEEKSVSLSVATTWQTSVEQLSANARKLLEVLSWLAPDPIPQTIFDALEQIGAFDDTEPLRAELRRLSLLQRADDAKFDTPGQVHPLVQLITHEQVCLERVSTTRRLIRRLLSFTTLKQFVDPKPALTTALNALCAAGPNNPQDAQTWPLWKALQPHMIAAIDHARSAEYSGWTTALMNGLGIHLHATAHFTEAESLLRRSLETRESCLLKDRSGIGISLVNLARLLKDTGRYTDAESLLRRALAILETELGLSHRLVATCLDCIASLLHATGRLVDAEPLMRRALAIVEATSALDHPDIALMSHNLALLLDDLERVEEALLLMGRVMEIHKTALSPNHPNVAYALDYLARLCVRVDRPLDAEKYLRAAIGITKASFGANHPSVALRLNNLARLLHESNRSAEAEPLYRSAINLLRQKSISVGYPLPELEPVLRNYSDFLDAMSLPADEIARRLAPFQWPPSSPTGEPGA